MVLLIVAVLGGGRLWIKYHEISVIEYRALADCLAGDTLAPGVVYEVGQALSDGVVRAREDTSVVNQILEYDGMFTIRTVESDPIAAERSELLKLV
jgi:hypothetical protein